jgi:hypothetical protein
MLERGAHNAIVLSVLLRYTDSDYPFGIFKLFFKTILILRRLKGSFLWTRCGPQVRCVHTVGRHVSVCTIKIQPSYIEHGLILQMS